MTAQVLGKGHLKVIKLNDSEKYFGEGHLKVIILNDSENNGLKVT